MPFLLTIASTVQCMHGGMAILSTENTEAQVHGQLILLETDTHPIVGCPWIDPATTSPSPCLTVRWVAGTGTVQARGRRGGSGSPVPMVFMPTIGETLNAKQLAQGIAILSNPSIADAL